MRNYFCAPFILIGIPHIIVWALKSNRSDYSNCYASYFISVNVIFFPHFKNEDNSNPVHKHMESIK